LRFSLRCSAVTGDAVDIMFLAMIGLFLLLTLALVAGCAALERKK
jgi:hypothetical protein